MKKLKLFQADNGVNYLVPFILVTTLFFLWGFAHSILDVLNKHFQDAFTMNKTRSALVQAVVYGGYFIMALPAGRIIRRFGYRTGVSTGLLLYGIGALMFIPGSYINSFEFSCSRCSSSVAGSPVWKRQPIPTSPCSALPTVQSAASTFPSRSTGLDGFSGRSLADSACLATTAISPCPMPSSALWCFWCSSFFCVCLCRKSRVASRATMRCNSVLAAPVFSAIPISSSVSRPCSATWPPKPASTVFHQLCR